MIGIHRIEGFYWVARTGGYARAARSFPYPITQPGVHQQVKKLEEELGISLFERAGKETLLLTPAGKRLYEFIEPFYAQLPGIVRSLGADDLSGELRIAAPSMYLHHLLPGWLRKLRDANADLRVATEETHWGNCEGLARGNFDVLVDYFPDVPVGLAAIQIATLRPFLIVPREHPLASRQGLHPSELRTEPFVSYLPGHLADLQRGGLARLGIDPPSIVTASTAQAILGFVAAGLGYSLVGWFGPEGPSHDGIVVHPLRSPEVTYPVWAAWRENAPDNPMLKAFLEAVQAPSPSPP